MPFFIHKKFLLYIYFNKGKVYMEKYIMDRVVDEALYMLENKSTIREIATIYNVSKSTVHKDLQERLRYINVELHNEIGTIFNEHLMERHIRGGEATKKKYLKKV